MSRGGPATAFAPASIGNLGVGFDMLGLAIDGAGDRVTATRVGTSGVDIAEVREPDGRKHRNLSSDAAENTASIAAQSLWHAHGSEGGVQLIINKGVALKSGMGSSAASAVAAVVAVNALLSEPLPKHELLMHALAGEKFASGGLHADNVAPSLLGGLVLCPHALLPRTIPLPVPSGVSSIIIHPDMQVGTAESRNALAREYSLEQWLEQQGYLAGFVAACAADDQELLALCLKDVTIEPQRAASVPMFTEVKRAALENGAFGCSLSGSGPAIFALCRTQDAARIEREMTSACADLSCTCASWISPMDARGARIVEEG